MGDGSRAISRPRTRDPNASVGDRWPTPLQHGRPGARSDREPPASCPAPAGRDRARDVLDAGRAVARGSRRSGREVSRRRHVRPRRDAGVDAGPGAAASPRHGPRRGTPLPEPRPARALFGPNASTSSGRARTSHGRSRRPVGAWDLGRSSDGAGPDRRAGRRGHRAAAPPRPRPDAAKPVPAVAESPRALEFFNGLGGFEAAGREYVTVLGPGQWTPAPWINVIANPGFGFQVSESGSGYTWSVNSRENQLTAWSNDPVTDPPSETLYVGDDETGALWGPTALPIREEGPPYVSRHGQGYSQFEHVSHGIALELLQLV